ncbi:torsin-1A-interacting protein 2-like [Adelges cooleyi]|uniref:torsin-1A-interacting protein 2-like n=1 Tax=Adelges cooleyi TaxID=133065 RepID=UPI00217F5956|nr:torsin-1A-interacting protein 2-like [Adelges cooleyi]
MTAPCMHECEKCKIPIEGYSQEFIKRVKKNAEKNFECELFIQRYNIQNTTKHRVTECQGCLEKTWNLLPEKQNKPKSDNCIPESQQNSSGFNNLLSNLIFSRLGLGLTFLFLGILLSTYSMSTDNSADLRNDTLDIDNFKYEINEQKKQFPSQRKWLWNKLRSGFRRLLNPGEPFVLLLLHDNKMTSNCLASMVGTTFKLKMHSKSNNMLWMDGSDWNSNNTSQQDEEDIIYQKLLLLEEHEVLVVENFQDLPWKAVKPFHFFCDAYNPKIKNAVYVLLLKVDGDRLNDAINEGKEVEMAERAINAIWPDMPNDERSPLISRLTTNVGIVIPEQNPECPYLKNGAKKIDLINIS